MVLMAMHILDSLVTLPPRDINGDNLIISQLSLHVTLALLNSGRGGGGTPHGHDTPCFCR